MKSKLKEAQLRVAFDYDALRSDWAEHSSSGASRLGISGIALPAIA
ncbi:hypothetical protein ACVI1L_005035 [Bradyrhizobium sp. USDA 4516]